MANVCSCYMTVSGNASQLDDLRNKIRGQDKSLDQLFTWFLGGDYYGLVTDPADVSETGSLYLDFTCKWSPPTNELENLAAAYPGLTFEIRYEESGNSIYGVLNYSGGVITEDATYDESTYLEKFDEDYAEFVQNLDDQPYDEFLASVLEALEGMDEGDTCRYAHLAEKKYLAKVKDQDLPLLISWKWQFDNNKREYEKRMKGIKP